jgi:hypothetical protein
MTLKNVKSFGYSLPTSYYSSCALHVYIMFFFNGHQKLADSSTHYPPVATNFGPWEKCDD